jgi:hypothetical protein
VHAGNGSFSLCLVPRGFLQVKAIGRASQPALRRSFILRFSLRIRMLILVAVVVAAASALGGCTAVRRATSVSSSATTMEQKMVNAINNFRVKNGRKPLHIHTELQRKAHNLVTWTVAGGCGPGSPPPICHSRLADGIHSRWTFLGENTGMVAGRGNISGMEGAFERSASHRATMLTASANFVGVGILYWGTYMYVVEEFMAAT